MSWSFTSIDNWFQFISLCVFHVTSSSYVMAPTHVTHVISNHVIAIRHIYISLYGS